MAMVGSYRLTLSLWLALVLGISPGAWAASQETNLPKTPASGPSASRVGTPQIRISAISADFKIPKTPAISQALPSPAAGISPALLPAPAPAAGLPVNAAEPPSDGAQRPAQEATRLGSGLDKNFDHLRRAFDLKSDDLAEEETALVAEVRANLHSQLDAMRKVEPEDEPLLSQIRQEGDGLLNKIDKLVAAGKIDPRFSLRTSEEDGPVRVQPRKLKVGVIPVAADPFQWGHLLIGLRSIAAYDLDKVVFILAGDDPRKPNMTKADFRHPMGEAVLKTFAPFFEYSSIAKKSNLDGETNIFHLLRLNPEQEMAAFYFAGKDHYKLLNKGLLDTLPKLKKNMGNPKLKFDRSKHSVEAVFIEREGGDAYVPTVLKVHFLPSIPFEASSTLVRKGHHALMPYSAYEYAQRHRPGLYGIPEKKAPPVP